MGQLNSCSPRHPIVSSPTPQNQFDSAPETIIKYLPNGKIQIQSVGCKRQIEVADGGSKEADLGMGASDDDATNDCHLVEVASVKELFDLCKNNEKNQQLLF